MDSSAIAISAATAVLDGHDHTNAQASQPAPIYPAPSRPDGKSESAPHSREVSERSLPPQSDDLTSGQHVSAAGAHSPPKPQGQLSQPSVKAAADQSAGRSQHAQHSRTSSEQERPQGVSHPHMDGTSTDMPRGTGTNAAVHLQHQSLPVGGSSPSSANHGSDITSQRAAAGSLMEQPVAVAPSADVSLTRSSSIGACQEEGCDSGTQPEPQAPSGVAVADRSSIQCPQGCHTGGSPCIAGNHSRQHLQSSSGGLHSMAGNSSRQDPQDTTGAPENGSEAAKSPRAVRSYEGRRSASPAPADDSPECSPADDDLVLVENRTLVPARPKHSQSFDSGGILLHAKGSGVSKSQDAVSAGKKVSHSAGQAELMADSEGKAVTAAGVEAANKENSVSSASLAGTDSQAGAQALMEEEQAKADAVAVAQVVVAFLHAD